MESLNGGTQFRLKSFKKIWRKAGRTKKVLIEAKTEV